MYKRQAHERSILHERNVKVCHCPFSNCAKGVPETPSLLEDGICVGLGTDGAAHGGLSLWNEMKTVSYTHLHSYTIHGREKKAFPEILYFRIL